MEPSNEEQPSFLDRTSRATRGKRMNKLLDDEVEEDEAFWNQDALLEEENDNEYEAEPEIADEFDSDFNEDESEPDDDGGQNEADAREKRPKKRLVYTGKPQTKKKKKKKDLSKLEESLRDEMDKDVSNSMEAPDGKKHSDQPTTPDHHEEGDEVEGEKSVRKSTRTAVVVRQAEREAIRAALQATTKPVKRKKEGEEKRMSQEEMLLEAAQTEITNLRHLERVLAREEEVKKRAIVHKEVYTGPQMRYSSKNGDTVIEFRNGLSFESEISTKSVPCKFMRMGAILIEILRKLYVPSLDCLQSTEIRKQGYLMQQKKLFKQYVNVMQLITCAPKLSWPVATCMIQLLGPDSWARGRD
ncbi:SWR1 complex subunit 2 isoform X2 [Spinacia oleracea]|uniref:SWR1 complex subunit 2 isoform X2 n=1 Tax=Spinacia oleracea TaxID=3562 RepID=A0ABM3RAL8_SPIOL|nr:SWR1 complex subunit 2 isoform X2 [Spinacia oleracea]